MVEAAVLMPVLIIIWMSTLYAERVCSSKLDTLAAARGKAWNYAASNCGNPGDTPTPGGPKGVSGNSGPAGGAPNIDAILQSAGVSNSTVRNLISTAGTFVFSLAFHPFPSSLDAESKSAQVSSHGGGVLEFSSTQTSKSVVMCNEPPFDGNFKQFFEALFHLIVK